MTPGFQAAISRLEGQWRNLFRRIRRIRRSAAIYMKLIAAGSRSYRTFRVNFYFYLQLA